MKNHSNICVCNFEKLNGCDFSYSPPIMSYQLMKANYTLIQKLQPVPIEMSLNLVKELLQHKDLKQLLKRIQERGKKNFNYGAARHRQNIPGH